MLAGGVKEFHILFLTFCLAVNVLLHLAGVIYHNLGTHPLLPALNSLIHILHILLEQSGGALGWLHTRVQGLAKAALLQLISGEGAGGGDVGGLVLAHLVALTANGDVSSPAADKRGHLAVSLAILSQHLVGGEDVAVLGGEVAIPEEGRGADDLLHDGLEDIGVKEIQSGVHV